MSTLSIAAPTESHGFMAKAGALAAGTALAGAALFGGVAVAPTIATSLTGSVQHDYVLTTAADPTDTFPTFEASLQSLLTALKFGNMGQVLGLFGDDADGKALITTGSDLSVLLAALNSKDMSLDTATGHLLSTPIGNLLSDVMVPTGPGTTAALGAVPIDDLIGGFIGGTGANESIGTIMTALGLGDFAGLLRLSFLGLSPDMTLSSLLNGLLGISSTTTLDSLVIGNGQTLGDATIGGLLGIDSTELAANWDQFVDNIKLGGTLIDPDGTGTLGDETLSQLLTSLLPAGSDAVGDGTSVTDFLGDLGIFSMLGLS